MLFQYTSIDRNTIRLVKFLPYSTPNNIYLSLEHQPRYFEENARPYNAISYRCGDLNDRKPITMGGRTFLVTSNMWSALSAMVQHCDTTSRFWVDSICINQQDFHEKSVQANQMWRIISSASKVVAWLGSDERTVKAFDVLREGRGQEDPEANELIAGSVLCQDYFRRAWVRAEILQARSVDLLHSQGECNLAALEAYLRICSPTNDIASATKKLIHARASRPQEASIYPQDKLQAILDEYADSHSLDARDRIMAMLNDPRFRSLAGDSLPSINYTQTREDVALRMICFLDVLAQTVFIESEQSKRTETFLASLAKALELPASIDAYRSMVEHLLEGPAPDMDKSGPIMRTLFNGLKQRSRY